MPVSDRWRRIEQLCHEALAREPDERAAFLEQACAGDAELRREVESLVALQSAVVGFLEPAAPGQGPGAPSSVVRDVSLAAGTRLGPYEITTRIGAGGMGEVYKARDTRLGRTVAIKILPPDLASDPDPSASSRSARARSRSERRRRFEQEARAVSALNHPNICTLYDIGSAAVTGAGSGLQGAMTPIDYLVMELVEGQTLAERLRKGPLPLAEALEYGAQIAGALGKAHRHGIIHRDLKPANIMLTKSGIKLLDFGLAKLRPAETAGATGRLSALPTATTTPGVVLGTVPYMAPEQLEGKETDARSDIFAFGCVLHEMLTGRRAFAGESEASVISAIMSAQPPLVSSLQPMTPPLLDRLVQRCLAKDPDDRAESARDVAFAIRSLNAGADAAQLPASKPSISRRWMALTLAAVVILFLGLALGWLVWHADRPLPSFRRLTFRRGVVYGARFTADGRNILFSAGWDGEPQQVFSVPYDSVDATLREGLQGLDVLAVSNRNEFALLREESRGTHTGTLARGPLAGSAPHDVSARVSSADWNPDGSELAVTRDRTVEYPINHPIYTARRRVMGVRMSPRGDLLAFMDNSDGHGHVIVIDTAGHTKVQSAYHDGLDYPVWTPDGREVWFSVSVPHAKISAVALDLSGRERKVLTDPTFRLKDISRDGRVLLAADDPLFGISGRGPGGASERNLTWFGWSMLDDISPDGRTIVFTEGGLSDSQNQWSTFVRSTDGSPPQQFEGLFYSKRSPDGRWLAGVGGDKNPPQVRLMPTTEGQGWFLTHDEAAHGVVGWLPDSSGIVYSAANRLMLAMLDRRPPTPITPEGWTSAGMGPDGRHVLAVSPDATKGAVGMFLYSIDGRERIPLPGVDVAQWMPVGWEPDGKRMRVCPRRLGDGLLPVFLLDPITGDARPWKDLGGQLDRAGLSSIGTGGRVHFSADGESYAYSYRRRQSTLFVAEGLR